MNNFDLRKYLTESRLTSNSKTLTEAGPKLFSQEFGGANDIEFLRVVWKLSVEDLERLLEEAVFDLKGNKNLGVKGKIMGNFNRREIQLLNYRIKLLKQVIQIKQKNPEYTPDSFK
jgi:hypothetical protein